jgi:hypothetical protein
MAKKNLSQSPRAIRDSTNDPEAFAKGEVQTNVDPSEAGVGHDVPNPWRHQSEQYSPKYEAEGYSPRKSA